VNKRLVGTFYEERAGEYLEKNGIVILKRNYRCKQGEIDIIGKDGNCVVFFEVKYRSCDNYGHALLAVDTKKQKKICKCATCFCMQNAWVNEFRYDVIAISDTKIEWMKNAFTHRGYGFY
jgi:putative endonuclease